MLKKKTHDETTFESTVTEADLTFCITIFMITNGVWSRYNDILKIIASLEFDLKIYIHQQTEFLLFANPFCKSRN